MHPFLNNFQFFPIEIRNQNFKNISKQKNVHTSDGVCIYANTPSHIHTLKKYDVILLEVSPFVDTLCLFVYDFF